MGKEKKRVPRAANFRQMHSGLLASAYVIKFQQTEA